jgi:hypothetical protein
VSRDSIPGRCSIATVDGTNVGGKGKAIFFGEHHIQQAKVELFFLEDFQSFFSVIHVSNVEITVF